MAKSLRGCIEEAARAMGYQNLKKEQLKVVSSFIAGNDVFVALPTGFGKSLCFASLPSTFNLTGFHSSCFESFDSCLARPRPGETC